MLVVFVVDRMMLRGVLLSLATVLIVGKSSFFNLYIEYYKVEEFMGQYMLVPEKLVQWQSKYRT